ncbi:MAG TPA: orotidine-5'-phosphate decarboxylase, partial [Kofleriaceae bacterium]|nr:orotidine-5'-phosphate decarboxylase [Kofleriaceae bacterium]
MAFTAGNRLIAALDVASRAEADGLIARLGGVPSWLKIGLELFCAEGPAIVRDHARAGRQIMLDLKLHDIPETVARATAQVAALGAGLVTVHAAGGRAMLEAAVRAAGDARVLAVTVLTSLDFLGFGLPPGSASLGDPDLEAIGVKDWGGAQVLRLARLARDAGCAGVVASPLEVAAIRAEI